MYNTIHSDSNDQTIIRQIYLLNQPPKSKISQVRRVNVRGTRIGLSRIRKNDQ